MLHLLIIVMRARRYTTVLNKREYARARACTQPHTQDKEQSPMAISPPARLLMHVTNTSTL